MMKEVVGRSMQRRLLVAACLQLFLCVGLCKCLKHARKEKSLLKLEIEREREREREKLYLWVTDAQSKQLMWFGGCLRQCGKRSERHGHWSFGSDTLLSLRI
jgi:hypothetical protein